MPKSNLIPAVAYLRASTDQQDTSCGDQLAEIRKYAKSNGYRIVKVYKDEGVSGWKASERSGFSEMIRDAARGTFRTILVWKQNRFSRFVPRKFMRYADELYDEGVTITTLDKGELDLDDIATFITAGVDGYGDNQYSKKLSEDVDRGMRQAIARGEWPFGNPPLGYVLKEKKLVLGSKRDQKLVRRIFKMYADGYSVRGVADVLNREGILSSKGCKWREGNVRHLLVNPAYVGEVHYRRRSPSAFVKNKEIEVWRDMHPPLVERKLWDKVKARRDRNRERPRTSPHRNGDRYVLTGMIRCGKCGGRMNGAAISKTHHPRYTCTQHNQSGSSVCEGSSVSEAELMQFVVNTIVDHFHGEETRQGLLDRALEDLLPEEDTDSDQIAASLEEVSEKIKVQQRKVIMCGDDPELVSMLQTDIRSLKASQEHLERQLAAASIPRAEIEAQAEATVEEYLRAIDDLRSALLEADTIHLRALLDEMVDTIEVWTNRLQNGKKAHYVLTRGCVTLRDNSVRTAHPASQAIRLVFEATDEWVPLDEALEVLGIHRRTAYRWAADGQLELLRKGKFTYVHRSGLPRGN